MKRGLVSTFVRYLNIDRFNRYIGWRTYTPSVSHLQFNKIALLDKYCCIHSRILSLFRFIVLHLGICSVRHHSDVRTGTIVRTESYGSYQHLTMSLSVTTIRQSRKFDKYAHITIGRLLYPSTVIPISITNKIKVTNDMKYFKDREKKTKKLSILITKLIYATKQNNLNRKRNQN